MTEERNEEQHHEVPLHRRGVLRRPSGHAKFLVNATHISLAGYLSDDPAEGHGSLERAPSHNVSQNSEAQVEEEHGSQPGRLGFHGSRAQQLALQQSPIRTRKRTRTIKTNQQKTFSEMSVRHQTSTRSLARLPSSYKSRTTIQEGPETAVFTEVAGKLVRVVRGAAIACMTEAQGLKDTTVKVVDETFGPESATVADRATGELVLATYANLDNADDDHITLAAKHGVGDQQMQALTLRKSTQSVKDLCGIRASKSQSQFDQLASNGRYHCGAAESDLRIGRRPKMQTHSTEDSDQEANVLLQRRKKHLREIGIQSREEQPDDMAIKSIITAETLEELWLQSQNGTIRNKPEPYNAVFDFLDGRITVPRCLNGHTAGQLQDVEPNLNANRTRGVVNIRSKTPRRHWVSKAANLEDVCDIKKIERQTLNNENCRQQDQRAATVQGQGHMHAWRKSPDLDEWNFLREMVRQKQEENERWFLLRRIGAFQDQQTHESDSGDSAHTVGVESDTLPEIWHNTRRVAVRKIMVQRDAEPPWDARPQLKGGDLNRFLEKIGLGQLKSKTESNEAVEQKGVCRANAKEERRKQLTMRQQVSNSEDNREDDMATTPVNLSDLKKASKVAIPTQSKGVLGDNQQQGGKRLPTSCGWC